MKKWECMPRKKLERRAEKMQAIIKSLNEYRGDAMGDIKNLYACCYQALLLSWSPDGWAHPQLEAWAREFRITPGSEADLRATLVAQLEAQKCDTPE